MPDETVARFKLRGRVCLWRYVKLDSRWDGWHFAADAEGCTSLLELLEIMEHAQFPSRVTLPLAKPPEAVLNVPNREIQHARPATSWTLIYPKDQVEPGTWELSATPVAVTLRFGSRYIPVLREGFTDVASRRGDYAIGPDAPNGTSLWLWWWVGARTPA